MYISVCLYIFIGRWKARPGCNCLKHRLDCIEYLYILKLVIILIEVGQLFMVSEKTAVPIPLV